MSKCKIHDPLDWVQCDDCDEYGCRECGEGWETDYDEGIRRGPLCAAKHRMEKKI